MSRVILPVNLPITFTDNSSQDGTIRLPVTLPLSFAQKKGGVKLPVKLPMRLGASKPTKKTIKLPISETCNYVEERVSKRLPLKETASVTFAKLPVKEQAWVFNGLIIEENVVGHMSKPLALLEDVRGRILVNAELLDRNHVKLTWYGDEVPEVEIHQKIEVDEEFEKVATIPWDVGEYVTTIDNNSYNIKLVGTNNTGESGIVSIDEPVYYAIDTKVNVSVNEKIYTFDCNFESVFKVNVNL